MADTKNAAPAAGGTPAAEGNTEKQTRASRNNHKAAELPITNIAQAQAYQDAVIKATEADKPQSMYNSSGFTTPGSLVSQDPENLLRMRINIDSALAVQTSNPQIRSRAEKCLAIGNEFGSNVLRVQKERALAEARALLEASGAKVTPAGR